MSSLLGHVVLAALIFAGAAMPVMADGPPSAQAAEHQLPVEALDITWEWVSFITPKEQIEVDDPGRYTLQLSADGAVALQVDCNRGFSQATLGADNAISFSPIGLTMMACPDDNLGHRFTTELERVGTYFMQDGDFFLELPFDSGTFRFRPASD